jgi:hypothetical protein
MVTPIIIIWYTGKEVVIKLVDKYNKRFEKYQAVIATTKQKQEYTVPELKAWLAVRKKKVEGAMPTTLAALKVMYEKLKDQEPLTLPEYLKDDGHSPSLIAAILETGGEEASGNGDDHDVDDANTLPSTPV